MYLYTTRHTRSETLQCFIKRRFPVTAVLFLQPDRSKLWRLLRLPLDVLTGAFPSPSSAHSAHTLTSWHIATQVHLQFGWSFGFCAYCQPLQWRQNHRHWWVTNGRYTISSTLAGNTRKTKQATNRRWNVTNRSYIQQIDICCKKPATCTICFVGSDKDLQI